MESNSKKEKVFKLVGKAKNGDAKSYGEIYDLYIDKIYKFVYFRVGTEGEAEDLTETIFLKAYQKINYFDEERDIPFEVWLFKIARNQITDYYRTKKKTVPLDELPEINENNPGPEELAEKKLLLSKVMRCLNSLHNSYKEIIILKFIEEKDNKEIGEILNKPPTQVRVLQSRALKALKKLVN